MKRDDLSTGFNPSILETKIHPPEEFGNGLKIRKDVLDLPI